MWSARSLGTSWIALVLIVGQLFTGASLANSLPPENNESSEIAIDRGDSEFEAPSDIESSRKLYNTMRPLWALIRGGAIAVFYFIEKVASHEMAGVPKSQIFMVGLVGGGQSAVFQFFNREVQEFYNSDGKIQEGTEYVLENIARMSPDKAHSLAIKIQSLARSFSLDFIYSIGIKGAVLLFIPSSRTTTVKQMLVDVLESTVGGTAAVLLDTTIASQTERMIMRDLEGKYLTQTISDGLVTGNSIISSLGQLNVVDQHKKKAMLHFGPLLGLALLASVYDYLDRAKTDVAEKIKDGSETIWLKAVHETDSFNAADALKVIITQPSQ